MPVRSSPRHRPPRRRIVATAVAALAATGLATAVPAGAADTADTVAISLDSSQQMGRLPADFVGLSYEMRELSTNCRTGDCVPNFQAKTGNLAALFQNLGKSNVRIAGNQLDRDTLWVPAGEQPPDPLPDWVQDVVTPTDIKRLDHFLKATGWQAEVGINLAHYDAALAANEGHTLTAVLGKRLLGAECGNEPNHYASNHYRPSPYDYEQHRADWEHCVAAAGPIPLAGPDLSSPHSTADWFSQFAVAEHQRLNLLTVHNYTGADSMDELLSPEIRTSEVTDAAPQLAAAKSVGVPIRMDETNSAVGGGLPGVSDTYASALWAMDYSLVMAQAGFAGLNFHGGLSVCNAPLYNGKYQRYTPICAADEADRQAGIFQAMPEYYGLYMASKMGPGDFERVAVDTDRNVTAYAVRGDDGRTRLAVIEKDPTSDAAVTVRVKLGRGNGSASVTHLTGTALDSAAGVAVQGATVHRNGRLRPQAADRVQVRNGTLRLRIPSGSAAIITLPGR